MVNLPLSQEKQWPEEEWGESPCLRLLTLVLEWSHFSDCPFSSFCREVGSQTA